MTARLLVAKTSAPASASPALPPFEGGGKSRRDDESAQRAGGRQHRWNRSSS
jgi:hypothetical protein